MNKTTERALICCVLTFALLLLELHSHAPSKTHTSDTSDRRYQETSARRAHIATREADNYMGKLSALFVGHGGGPLPLLGDPHHATMARFFAAWPKTLQASPKALLTVSAHWEEPVATVTAHPQPDLIYDYYGFPPETYTIKYPAPGSPELAERITQLLTKAGLPAKQDRQRGWDHGVFVPLKLMYPEADIPLVELSVLSSLDPEAHIAVGEALAPLREEGVLIIGSGFSFHNLQAFRAAGTKEVTERSRRFDNWLQDVMCSEAYTWEQRKQLLAAWEKAPEARFCHPREEHLMPLLVAFGAGKPDAGRVVWHDTVMSAVSSSFQFG